MLELEAAEPAVDDIWYGDPTAGKYN